VLKKLIVISMPELDLRGFVYVLPVKAEVTVIDSAFHAKGDVNWDGYIDATDLDLLKAAFGAKPGDPNWNPDCDLNGDGIINVKDVGVCGVNQGSSAPKYVTPAKAPVASGKCVLIGTFRVQRLTKELVAGTRVAFIFTALGLWGRVVVIPF